jgi:hypothetical protein
MLVSATPNTSGATVAWVVVGVVVVVVVVVVSGRTSAPLRVGMGMNVSDVEGVRVGVGVDVAARVGVRVGSGISGRNGAWLGVADAVGSGVAVGASVVVGTAAAVAVSAAAGTGVAVGTGVALGASVAVAVGGIGVRVAEADGAGVRVGVATVVDVLVGVAVTCWARLTCRGSARALASTIPLSAHSSARRLTTGSNCATRAARLSMGRCER